MITCSDQAAKTIHPNIPKRLIKNQECFVVLCLDTNNEPIGKSKLVALGTVNRLDVHPRDIFRDAIRRNAMSIIVAHNHPSGKINPSDDDHELTKRLVKAGELLGIPVLDHLIIAPDGRYTSLADTGCM